jgi:hypothetical protein
MKISHELPLSLLKNSYQWNDYEYCLPIFMKKFPQYKNHYIKARDDGRFIIMDNSLFEGYYHSDSELLEFINEIKPDIFIVPDEWNDKNKTLVNAKSWILNYKSKLLARVIFGSAVIFISPAGDPLPTATAFHVK